jgi:serine/threonine protein kinase
MGWAESLEAQWRAAEEAEEKRLKEEAARKAEEQKKKIAQEQNFEATRVAETKSLKLVAVEPERIDLKQKYIASAKLGEGAYGTVFLGEDRATGEKAAIKRIAKGRLQGQEKASVMREVAVLAELKGHPTILHLLGFYESPDAFYIVTEVAAGGELFDRIIEKTIYSEADARGVVRTLLQALDFLAERQIAHRDLKPENLLLRYKGNDTDIVIADFGLAAKASGRSLKAFCGTVSDDRRDVVWSNPTSCSDHD